MRSLTSSEEYRRRINRQLVKGEALHALRDFLFFANKGKVRKKHEEEQLHQASCLNLLTNAVVVWNTVFMAVAIEQLQAEGYPVREEDVTHLSPQWPRMAIPPEVTLPSTVMRCAPQSSLWTYKKFENHGRNGIRVRST